MARSMPSYFAVELDVATDGTLPAYSHFETALGTTRTLGGLPAFRRRRYRGIT